VGASVLTITGSTAVVTAGATDAQPAARASTPDATLQRIFLRKFIGLFLFQLASKRGEALQSM
jgi:hypothetical protein